MEMKLKFAEFAELIGTTAKTVYKMEEREEIITVTEKVNNRPTRLVITNSEQINHFKNIYSKSPVNVGNCEDIVTNNNYSMNVNNSTQSTNTPDVMQEVFDKIVTMNEQYNNRIAKLNEELIDSKSKLLFLEDKASREGLYLKEINELKTENNELKTNKTKVINLLVSVIVVLLMVIVGFITFNIAISEKQAQKDNEVIEPTPTVKVNTKTSKQPVKTVNQATKRK
jgi:hypothetical protein